MNLRNFKIFGFRALRPRRVNKVYLLAFILLIAVGTISMLSFNKESGSVTPTSSSALTGATTVIKQTEETGEEVKVEEKVEEEKKEFFDYQGECARLIKQKQDDVNDIAAQVKSYEDEYNRLIAEYEEKLKALEEEFIVPMDNAKKDAEKVRRELEKVETSLASIQTSCDKNPS